MLFIKNSSHSHSKMSSIQATDEQQCILLSNGFVISDLSPVSSGLATEVLGSIVWIKFSDKNFVLGKYLLIFSCPV